MATFADFTRALARVRLGVLPAELHGAVCGYLCAGWGGDARELLAALELDDRDTGVLHDLLNGVAAEVAEHLRAGEPVLPLLPAGDLEARANALVEWCRGFLGGLGLTGIAGEFAHVVQVREDLDALGRIAAAPVACEADDDAVLGDLVAFVAAVVARLHATLAPAPVARLGG